MGPLEILLFQALSSPLGLVVRVTDFERANQALYAARRKCGDPDLDVLQFRRSPLSPEDELWIVKGTAKDAPQPTPPPSDSTALTRLDLESHVEDSTDD